VLRGQLIDALVTAGRICGARPATAATAWSLAQVVAHDLDHEFAA
jgi:hypothetical protein